LYIYKLRQFVKATFLSLEKILHFSKTSSSVTMCNFIFFYIEQGPTSIITQNHIYRRLSLFSLNADVLCSFFSSVECFSLDVGAAQRQV